MIIKKFTGKTESEAREAAKSALGERHEILSVKTVRPTGFFAFLKKNTYEVTAAIEDVSEEPTKRFFDYAKEKNVVASNKPIEKEAVDVSEIPPVYSRPVVRTAPKQEEASTASESDKKNANQNLEKRIDELQQYLETQFREDKLAGNEKHVEEAKTKDAPLEKKKYEPVLDRIEEKLLENEVDASYVKQIMEEVKKSIPDNAGIDTVLSSAYQRIILKFGQAEGISLSGHRPKVVFFVGPTGVGKTTTIAKIASHYKVEQGKSIALLTADTYRIAATDQLRVYADILNAPLSIIYSAEELNDAVKQLSDQEIILVDTAGFSHKNTPQKDDMKELLNSLHPDYEKEVYLVVSATTKYKDLKDIVDAYTDFGSYKLIFTKLDETNAYGNLLNIHLYTGSSMSYSTNGQNVPDDIELFNAQRLAKQLLGGK